MFVDLRLKIKHKKYEIIKLKNAHWAEYIFTILLGIVAGLIAYYEINKVGKDYLFFIFLLLLIPAMISRLLLSGRFIIINEKGIKNGSVIKWDSITLIKRNKHKPTEMLIDYKNKQEIIDFYTEDKINEFKLIVNRISPDTYNLFLTEL